MNLMKVVDESLLEVREFLDEAENFEEDEENNEENTVVLLMKAVDKGQHDLTFGAQCSDAEPLQTQRFAQNLSCAKFQFLKDKIDQNTNFEKLPHLFLVYKN